MMTGDGAKGIRISGGRASQQQRTITIKLQGKVVVPPCSSLPSAAALGSGVTTRPHHFVSAVLGPAFLARRRQAQAGSRSHDLRIGEGW